MPNRRTNLFGRISSSAEAIRRREELDARERAAGNNLSLIHI